MINGSMYHNIVLTETMVLQQVSERMSVVNPAGAVLDIGHLRGLGEAVGDRPVITADDFTADIVSLPFADKAFGALVGHWVIDRLHAPSLPEILRELSRVSHLMILVFVADLIPGQTMRSTQEPDGTILNEFSPGWLFNAVQSWPDPWKLDVERFRTAPGGIFTAWRSKGDA